MVKSVPYTSSLKPKFGFLQNNVGMNINSKFYFCTNIESNRVL